MPSGQQAAKAGGLERRALGRSGIDVSVIGFGAWGIGGLTAGATSYGETDDTVSRRALLAAYERGINFFDTAPAYGAGRSERLIGETLAAVRNDVVISTKGGMPDFGLAVDFSPIELKRALDGSLRRLRSDYVDLYLLHNPTDPVFDKPDPVASLVEALRQDGVIRAFGVSVARPEDGLIAMERFELDTIQINFNLVDQRVIDCGLMENAARRGVALIARTPLCFGLLSGAVARDARFDPTDHRSRWSQAQIALWATAADRFAASLEGDAIQTKAQIALRYCLSYPIVATTIPGMLTEDEVMENSAAGAFGPLSSRELDTVRGIYREHSFFVEGRSG
ncbi:MAG: aldo/keto reductase [Alphaproteobacteria bacterium]|nr:aldo/keto reductase [Alphaproteobacteria bacterium]